MDRAYKGLGTLQFPYKPGPQYNPKGTKLTVRIIRSGGCCNQLMNEIDRYRYAPVLAPDREFCESEVRGKYKEPPHLLAVRAGNSFDPCPVWLRQEAEWGAQWRRLRPDRGGDRAAAAAITGVL